MRIITKTKYGVLLPIFFACFMLTAQKLSASIADNTQQPEQLFAPSVSKKFYEIAYDLANSDNATYIENEQAIAFLLAALNLDDKSENARSLLIKCACRYPNQGPSSRNKSERGYFDLVFALLQEYVDENASLDLTHNAVMYLLEQIDSPAQREALLRQMLDKFANTNSAFSSELATMLGLLKLQGGSSESAEQYFRQAYKNNKHNKFAFSKLVELAPEKIEPTEYLEHLRLAFCENPVDVQTALSFAQRAEQMQLYEIAADAYEYCSELFSYLHPAEPLPANIYIPWSISCYNSRQRHFQCLEIAAAIRRRGKFDIMLESLAGRAASKLGENEVAAQVIRDAERKAVKSINNNLKDVTETQLAWFYCFVIPIPDKAIEWSNKAFSTDSNSPAAASLLAYSLVQQGEYNSAVSLINNFERSQISELALAQIQIQQDQTAQGIETLKNSISKDPGSFAAERARVLLAQQGQAYTPKVNPDSVRLKLERAFGQKIVPSFIVPERMLSASFNIRNEELTFGGELDSIIAIINKSSEPMIISDNSLFMGNIRIDAIVSGDMNKRIPNLVSKRIRTANTIDPGRSTIINLKLITGELRDMLMTYPQANLNITFILYLDPETTTTGIIKNRLSRITPISANVKRPGIQLTGQYLRSRVGSISTGTTGQKIQSSQLFIGLLKEQKALENRTTPYHVVFTGDIKTLVEQALIYDSGLRKPDDDDWLVKVYTMAEMLSLPMVDYELVEAISENLYSAKWPVRMMAVYLLAESQGRKFTKVLESISASDSNQLVRDIANIQMLKSGSISARLQLN